MHFTLKNNSGVIEEFHSTFTTIIVHDIAIHRPFTHPVLVISKHHTTAGVSGSQREPAGASGSQREPAGARSKSSHMGSFHPEPSYIKGVF